ncbi:carbon-phosphorus lyase subunit PhnH [Mesorhizobium tianshanense]|uniref:Alpha-D-ribose 1-methylphosphonate 5-triphosphate synthase subunit PhnH n=1 Tax=Mesorhizobium tianshanense TaxID=39844 RepID=A0A562NN62_9HYPH|nr:phosphonate C-P lyase system protein PhnH [Mesorhizobium tianshanense]TWI33186.1 alpha-D-ribose 1-methylphosphonate 5-triphosphate synthase subunit PhnH [Mesorhizobium tianshanense]GLS34941.1 carbon-phosphorus lyase subunit PhnH [Mesorhizobium tianshanense]
MKRDLAAPELRPAFADPVFDTQAVFRTLMSAVAYPGRIFPLDRSVSAPHPLDVAATALCLTLADFETPIWLDGRASSDEARSYLRFHCEAPQTTDKKSARFALIADPSSMPHLMDFHPGDVEFPDRSTTLIVQVPSLTEGPTASWFGPGINQVIKPGIAGLPDWFWPEWNLCSEIYPMGVDVFFISGDMLVGLPRAVRVEV